MFSHPKINVLHNHTITRVLGCKLINGRDCFTVPFIKDSVKHLLYYYTSHNNLDLYLSAPKPLMEPLIPANFPVVGEDLIVFGESINHNDWYLMQAKIIKSTNVKTDGSGSVDTSVPRKEYLYFTLSRTIISLSSTGSSPFFDLSGRPATLDLAYHSEDSTKTDPSIDANLTESDDEEDVDEAVEAVSEDQV